jgi:hypothetical protein
MKVFTIPTRIHFSKLVTNLSFHRESIAPNQCSFPAPLNRPHECLVKVCLFCFPRPPLAPALLLSPIENPPDLPKILASFLAEPPLPRPLPCWYCCCSKPCLSTHTLLSSSFISSSLSHPPSLTPFSHLLISSPPLISSPLLPTPFSLSPAPFSHTLLHLLFSLTLSHPSLTPSHTLLSSHLLSSPHPSFISSDTHPSLLPSSLLSSCFSLTHTLLSSPLLFSPPVSLSPPPFSPLTHTLLSSPLLPN